MAAGAYRDRPILSLIPLVQIGYHHGLFTGRVGFSGRLNVLAIKGLLDGFSGSHRTQSGILERQTGKDSPGKSSWKAKRASLLSVRGFRPAFLSAADAAPRLGAAKTFYLCVRRSLLDEMD